MKEVCHQCKMDFIESPTQAYERAKKDGFPICRDCQRIAKASYNALKREEKRKQIESLPHIDQAKYYYKQKRKLSCAFLQRKLKISLLEAKEILIKLNHPIQ